MIPVATTRIFLLFAILIATVLIVSASMLFAERSGAVVEDRDGVTRLVALFSSGTERPGAEPTPEPTSTPVPEQVGRVKGARSIAPAFPTLYYPASSKSPFMPTPTPERMQEETPSFFDQYGFFKSE